MEYNLIQPPFSLKFYEMEKTELKEYFRWYIAQIPNRINVLSVSIAQEKCKCWENSFTPNSLKILGKWFAEQVSTRKISQEERWSALADGPFPVDPPEFELTNETISKAMDVGIYFALVFLRQFPSLKWFQDLRNRRSAHYGQPVLTKFKGGDLNPTSLMITLAYGIARNHDSGESLYELYCIWKEEVLKN